MATVAPTVAVKSPSQEVAPRRLLAIITNVIAAIAFTAGTYYLVVFIAERWASGDSATARFLKYGTDVVIHRGTIPYWEVFFFFLGSVMLLREYVARRREKSLARLMAMEWEKILANVRTRVTEERRKRSSSAMPEQEIPEADTIPQRMLGEVMKALDAIPQRLLHSKLGNRIYYAVRRYDKTKTSTEVDDILKIMSEIDADSKDSFYANVRFFLWLIPALGFLGTVIGIGLGVGGFGAMIESAGSFAEVQELLPSVTRNLGIAFDTTLLALLLTAVMTGAMSYQLRREEDLLGWIDAYCMEEVAGNFEDSDTHSHLMRKLFMEQNNLLSKHFGALSDDSKKVESGISRMGEKMDENAKHLRELREGSVTATGHLNSAAVSTKSIAQVFAQGAKASADLSGTAATLSEVATVLRKFVDQGSMADAAEFTRGVAELKRAVDPIGNAVKELAAVAHNLSGLADLSRVTVTLAEAAKSMESGANRAREGGIGMAQAGEGLRSVIGENREVLESVKGVLNATSQNILELRDSIFQMTETVLSVQRSIQLVADQVKKR